MKQTPTLCLLLALCTPFLAHCQQRSSWGQQRTQYQVSHIDYRINSKGNETGACVVGDSVVLYSSTQDMSTHGGFFAYNYSLMQVWQAPILSDGNVGKGTKCNWGMNSTTQHTNNVAYDALNNRLFFTRCNPNDDALRSQIYVMQYEKGKWKRAKKVGGNVNMKGYTNTQPSVGYLQDGTTVLFFISDRPGGCGGKDIWYALIGNSKVERSINLGTPVNTPNDEATPFYDNDAQTLYFSSNRTDGNGGWDVYCSAGNRNSWTTPKHLDSTVNSELDEFYFSVWKSPATIGLSGLADGKYPCGFLASNRKDSFFATDTSCCNDIYLWQLKPIKDTLADTLQQPRFASRHTYKPYVPEVRESRILSPERPIHLYFHNDEPDPKSESGKTNATYFQTYNRYMFMRPQYLEAQMSIADSAQRDSACRALNDFFDREVHDNCDRFETFIEMVAQKVMEGFTVSLTVSGYASPLHTDRYNKALSQRRINTIVNQLYEWHDGKLKPYLDHGALEFIEVPYGSSHAECESFNKKSNIKNGVFSVEAAKERRIEILDYAVY